jgi:hypothetical protein
MLRGRPFANCTIVAATASASAGTPRSRVGDSRAGIDPSSDLAAPSATARGGRHDGGAGRE